MIHDTYHSGVRFYATAAVVIVQSFLPFLAHFLHIGTAELGSLDHWERGSGQLFHGSTAASHLETIRMFMHRPLQVGS
jgi:hypothetical protein